MCETHHQPSKLWRTQHALNRAYLGDEEDLREPRYQVPPSSTRDPSYTIQHRQLTCSTSTTIFIISMLFSFQCGVFWVKNALDQNFWFCLLYMIRQYSVNLCLLSSKSQIWGDFQLESRIKSKFFSKLFYTSFVWSNAQRTI